MASTIFNFDEIGLSFIFAFLAESTPAFGGGEEGLEVFLLKFRGEGQFSFWAVIFVTAKGSQTSPAGHGATVVVATFDFVPWVVLFAVIAIRWTNQ